MQTGPRRVHLERSDVIHHRGGRSWSESAASNSSKTSRRLTEKSNRRRHTRAPKVLWPPLTSVIHARWLPITLVPSHLTWHSRFGQLSEKAFKSCSSADEMNPSCQKDTGRQQPKSSSSTVWIFYFYFFFLLLTHVQLDFYTFCRLMQHWIVFKYRIHCVFMFLWYVFLL